MLGARDRETDPRALEDVNLSGLGEALAVGRAAPAGVAARGHPCRGGEGLEGERGQGSLWDRSPLKCLSDSQEGTKMMKSKYLSPDPALSCLNGTRRGSWPPAELGRGGLRAAGSPGSIFLVAVEPASRQGEHRGQVRGGQCSRLPSTGVSASAPAEVHGGDRLALSRLQQTFRRSANGGSWSGVALGPPPENPVLTHSVGWCAGHWGQRPAVSLRISFASAKCRERAPDIRGMKVLQRKNGVYRHRVTVLMRAECGATAAAPGACGGRA